MRLGRQKAMMVFFGITLLLGLAFLGVEIYEFVHYVNVGAGLQTSAFTAILLSTLANTRCTRYIWIVLGTCDHDSSEKAWSKC